MGARYNRAGLLYRFRACLFCRSRLVFPEEGSELLQCAVAVGAAVLLVFGHLSEAKRADECNCTRLESDVTYVLPVPSTSKIGFQPNLPGPRGGTMRPSTRPSKMIGSVPGPALYANVHSAHALFVGKPCRSVFRPDGSVDVWVPPLK